MQRPRNRQPRPPTTQQGGGRGRGGRDRGGRNATNHPRPAYPTSVPTVTQVVPGARVSIVLKEDQPTGREVQGTVADVLTRGNHPRGIKVRLQDGRVGRVQRMDDGTTSSSSTTARPNVSSGKRLDDDSSGPPPRTLADFLPDSPVDEREGDTFDGSQQRTAAASPIVICPICGNFEGDELAVSHHVDSHLT